MVDPMSMGGVFSDAEDDHIRGLYMNAHLSDVLLLFPAGATEVAMSVPAHRLLLSLRSGAFRTAFLDSSTSYTNATAGSKRLRLPLKIIVQDTPYAIFKEMLRFIYTGKIQSPVEPVGNFWLELLQAAARYDIPRLCILCIEAEQPLLPTHAAHIMDILNMVDSDVFHAMDNESPVVAVMACLVNECMRMIMAMPHAEMQRLLQLAQCSTERLLTIYRQRTSVPLVLAIQHQNLRVVDALLTMDNAEALLSLADDTGMLPLVAALASQNEAIVRRVLVPPALDEILLENSLQSWFLMACASGNVLHCRILVNEHGADVNLISTLSDTHAFGHQQTPLHIASSYGHVDVVVYLLSLNAVPNYQDSNGNTPLHVASTVAVAEVLADKCNPNIPNHRGQVPMHVAAGRGDIGIVSLLFQQGADLDVLDDQGQTPFHMAAANGHAPVVLILLKLTEDRASEVELTPDTPAPAPGFDINAVDYKNNTALNLAAMAPSDRCEKILQVLLENGSDPNIANWFGYTPLHTFCAHHTGPVSVIDMFIEQGAVIHVQSLDGSTPLHLAVGTASEAVAIALVRAGAPVYVQDLVGRSVVNLAESTSQGVMVVPILKNVNVPPPWVADDGVVDCMSCGQAFGMAMRKHHCRHCGRIICYQCSSNRIPLPKFNQPSAARVCDVCFDVLSFRKLM
ncbi:myosin-like protein [Achlya hypogyna]|uniref:Myosin-like protein n=1 Tax=Achlya hypogyna TaxID=1202772 RepID=A0A1V9ZLW5_ACHHY|nr:myosin-like protein [Achlya hypogyna]